MTEKLINPNPLPISDKKRQETIEDIRKTYAEVKTHITADKLFSEYADLELIKDKTEKQKKRIQELSATLSYTHTLHNGLMLYNMTNTKDKNNAVIEIRRSLIREYKNPTDSELILIDQVVAAYWRARQYEIYLNRTIEPEPDNWSFNQLKINMMKELHRGLDQANRQIDLSLGLLKQGRQPNLNIRVSTDKTYIAQNQQIITQDKPKEEDNTIINAK